MNLHIRVISWLIIFLFAMMPVALMAEGKVLIAGDSTVENVAPKYKNRKGWGQVFGQFCRDDIQIVNLARGGRSTKNFRKYNDWNKLLSRTTPGDFILLQFGHNDSHKKDQPESTDAKTDYKDNLRLFADEAAKAGATLIFVTPPHRRVFGRSGRISQALAPYANAMKAVAKEKNLAIVDLYSMTEKEMQTLGDKGTVSLFAPNDRSHFSDKGAVWLASLIAGDIKRQKLPMAVVLK